MRILIVTQYIYPEPFKSSEMAFELAKRGYKVDVLTGIPNYPEGHYYSGYGLFRKRKEKVNGVTFYRCLQTPRKLFHGFWGLSVNYLSFALNATLWVFFFFLWKKRYDAIIAHEPSPITQIIPACILGDLRRIPVYSWIQDIWPDSAVSSLNGKYSWIARFLDMVTDWVYRHSTKLLITSKGMTDLINRNADYSDKIMYFPQWSEDMSALDKEMPSSVRDVRSDGFTIMMVGSLNSGIGVSDVLSLCYEMRNDDVHFVFVGGGSEEQNMRQYVNEHKLNKVMFTGRRPSVEMPFYFAQADALLLTLAQTESKHLDIMIPARFQSYLSAGKPIFAMIGSEVSEIINEAECGFSVPAGDYKSIADLIRKRALCHSGDLQRFGKNGRKLFENYYTRQECIDKLCRTLALSMGG